GSVEAEGGVIEVAVAVVRSRLAVELVAPRRPAHADAHAEPVADLVLPGGQPEQPVEGGDFDDVARATGVADPGFEDPQAVLPEGFEPGLAALHLAVELVGQVATHEALAGQGDAGVPRPALVLPVL